MMVFSSNLFQWDKHTQTFVGEVSDLGPLPQGFESKNGRPGIHIKSERTGAVLWFECFHQYVNQDNELEYWRFQVYHRPTKKMISLKLYND